MPFQIHSSSSWSSRSSWWSGLLVASSRCFHYIVHIPRGQNLSFILYSRWSQLTEFSGLAQFTDPHACLSVSAPCFHHIGQSAYQACIEHRMTTAYSPLHCTEHSLTTSALHIHNCNALSTLEHRLTTAYSQCCHHNCQYHHSIIISWAGQWPSHIHYS